LKGLLRISRAIDNFVERLGVVVNFLVLLVIVVGFLNVVLRYAGRWTNSDLFGDITKAITGTAMPQNAIIEAQWYLFAIMFFLGFPYILKHGVNVRVDFLYSKWNRRSQAAVDFFGTLLILIPFCLLGIYVAIPNVVQSWGYNSFKPTSDLLAWLGDLRSTGAWEMSPDPGGLPRAPIKSFIIVAFVLLLLQAISQAIKYFAIMRGGVGSQEAERMIQKDEQPEVVTVIEEAQERAKEIAA